MTYMFSFGLVVFYSSDTKKKENKPKDLRKDEPSLKRCSNEQQETSFAVKVCGPIAGYIHTYSDTCREATRHYPAPPLSTWLVMDPDLERKMSFFQ